MQARRERPGRSFRRSSFGANQALIRQAIAAWCLLALFGGTAAGAQDLGARALFIIRCAQCHLPDGAGISGVAPPLRNQVRRFALKSGGSRYLARVITFGLSGPIEANGERYNGAMPSFSTLPVDQRAQILNYAASLGSLRPTPKPLTASDVDRFTRDTQDATDPSALRRERAALQADSSTKPVQPLAGAAIPAGQIVRLGRRASHLQPVRLVEAERVMPKTPRLAQTAPLMLTAQPMRGAQLDYARNCQGCHLSSGEGITGEVPALKDFVGHFMRSREGRAYIPRVPGVAYSPLSNVKLAVLLNWVLYEFSAAQLPANFAPYTTAEVAVLRARPLTDFATERARVLRGLVADHQRRRSVLTAAEDIRTARALTP